MPVWKCKLTQMPTFTDVRGGVTTYAYDFLGRTTSITAPDPDGGGPLTSAVTGYTYSDRGLHIVTDALGETVTYAYDDYGNIESLTDDAGQVTDYTYDPPCA